MSRRLLNIIATNTINSTESYTQGNEEVNFYLDTQSLEYEVSNIEKRLETLQDAYASFEDLDYLKNRIKHLANSNNNVDLSLLAREGLLLINRTLDIPSISTESLENSTLELALENIDKVNDSLWKRIINWIKDLWNSIKEGFKKLASYVVDNKYTIIRLKKKLEEKIKNKEISSLVELSEDVVNMLNQSDIIVEDSFISSVKSAYKAMRDSIIEIGKIHLIPRDMLPALEKIDPTFRSKTTPTKFEFKKTSPKDCIEAIDIILDMEKHQNDDLKAISTAIERFEDFIKNPTGPMEYETEALKVMQTSISGLNALYKYYMKVYSDIFKLTIKVTRDIMYGSGMDVILSTYQPNDAVYHEHTRDNVPQLTIFNNTKVFTGLMNCLPAEERDVEYLKTHFNFKNSDVNRLVVGDTDEVRALKHLGELFFRVDIRDTYDPYIEKIGTYNGKDLYFLGRVTAIPVEGYDTVKEYKEAALANGGPRLGPGLTVFTKGSKLSKIIKNIELAADVSQYKGGIDKEHLKKVKSILSKYTS